MRRFMAAAAGAGANEKTIYKYVYKIEEHLILTDDRPRTMVGPQVDHVTSYAVFKELLRKLEQNNDEPVAIIMRLYSAIDDISTDTKEALNLMSLRKNLSVVQQRKIQKKGDDVENVMLNLKEKYGKMLAEFMDKKISEDILRAVPPQYKEIIEKEFLVLPFQRRVLLQQNLTNLVK